MLVLSRLPEQEVVINDNIVITVLEIRGDKVRLGITAPASIGVHRREVYERIEREAVTNVKDTEPPELGNIDGVNATAYGCHCCGKPSCVDKACFVAKTGVPG